MPFFHQVQPRANQLSASAKRPFRGRTRVRGTIVVIPVARTLIPVVVLLASAPATAKPFPDTLSLQQIAAAGSTARARLPPVNRAAADACKAASAHSSAELSQAATCLQGPGA